MSGLESRCMCPFLEISESLTRRCWDSSGGWIFLWKCFSFSFIGATRGSDEHNSRYMKSSFILGGICLTVKWLKVLKYSFFASCVKLNWQIKFFYCWGSMNKDPTNALRQVVTVLLSHIKLYPYRCRKIQILYHWCRVQLINYTKWRATSSASQSWVG